MPANTNEFFLERASSLVWWPKDRENVSGSIPETEVSLVKQDTDVAPDIGRANHE